MTELKFVTVDTRKFEERVMEDKPLRGSRTPAVWISFKSGDEFEVRILPPWTVEGDYAYLPYMKIFQHWDVGPDGKRVICPHMMSNRTDPCYVCEQIDGLFKTKDKNDAKRARKMRAGQSFIYQVIDRNDPVWLETDDAVRENPELVGRPKIKFMRLPYTGHSTILGFYNDADYGDLSHHLNGLDIKVKRTGTGLDTEYHIKTKRHNSPMFGSPEEPDLEAMQMVLEDLYKLDEHPFFRVATYDETVALCVGEDANQYDERHSLPPQPAQRGLLPGNSDPLQAWIAEGSEVWLDGKAGVPRTKKEVADAYGVSVSKVSDCYGEDANHQLQGCQICPIRIPCIPTFHSKHGKWSTTQPDQEVPSSGGGILGRPMGDTANSSSTMSYAASVSPAPTTMDYAPDNSPTVSSRNHDEDVSSMMSYLEDSMSGDDD